MISIKILFYSQIIKMEGLFTVIWNVVQNYTAFAMGVDPIPVIIVPAVETPVQVNPLSKW